MLLPENDTVPNVRKFAMPNELMPTAAIAASNRHTVHGCVRVRALHTYIDRSASTTSQVVLTQCALA